MMIADSLRTTGLFVLLTAVLAVSGCAELVDDLRSQKLQFASDGDEVLAFELGRDAFLRMQADGGSVDRFIEPGTILHRLRTANGWRYLRYRDGVYSAVEVRAAGFAKVDLPSPVNRHWRLADGSWLMSWDENGTKPEDDTLIFTGRAFWQRSMADPLVPIELQGPPVAVTTAFNGQGETTLAIFSGGHVYLTVQPDGAEPVAYRVPMSPEGVTDVRPAGLFSGAGKLFFYLEEGRDLFVLRLPNETTPPTVNILDLGGAPLAAAWDPAAGRGIVMVEHVRGTERLLVDPYKESVTRRLLAPEFTAPRMVTTATGRLYWQSGHTQAAWEARGGDGWSLIEWKGNARAVGATGKSDRVFAIVPKSAVHDGSAVVLYDAAEAQRSPVSLPGRTLTVAGLTRIGDAFMVSIAGQPAWIRVEPDTLLAQDISVSNAFPEERRNEIGQPYDFLSLPSGYFVPLASPEYGEAGVWMINGQVRATVDRVLFRGFLDDEDPIP